MTPHADAASTPSGIRGQGGAVAVIIAIMVVVLVGIVAFTVDFGMGYNNRSDLQTSADAAALAAAARLQELGATTCSDAEVNRSEARAVGEQVMEDNVGNDSAFRLAAPDMKLCDPSMTKDDVPITVTWTNTATQDTSLGGVWNKSTLEIAATATAVVNDAMGGSEDAVRPWVLCSAGVQSVPGTDIKHLKFPDKGTATCPAPTTGNWWIADCPGTGTGNSAEQIAASTINGCPNPMQVVDPQSSDPTDRSNDLLEACPPGGTIPENCLAANSVNILVDPVWEALMYLTCNDVTTSFGDCYENGPVVPFPVFCGSDACEPAATSPSPGDPAQYPVHRIVDATVCGWNFLHNARSRVGVCAGMPDTSSDDNSLWLVFDHGDVNVSLIN